ncbi:hypothetical protein A3D11_00200 [Candidatus Peribacteria bacterium RIFCSPHIGHO2_02_FULL_49_16]|nr:MAG: hypothetical protein A2880_02315 [Candidatus Peribacteria bacterium RIFCSPHIGHO2_01_FULL_49_38]OGJ60019.1 MAG: hypothetical protein A3D11_00200 [Candidatus Peribacteria bacterium RIFCSPHIGHO2_02_FULL_49_16]
MSFLDITDPHVVHKIPEGQQLVIWHDMRYAESYDVDLTLGPRADVLFVGYCPRRLAKKVNIMQYARIEEYAKLQWINVTFGGEVEQMLHCECVGIHAQSDVRWIFAACDAEKQALSVKNTFSNAEGRGNILMKGIAEDTAHIHCRGFIDIGFNARGTDAYLTQNVLMLDSTAKIDAVPGLEIKTNDVKASHSATVSRMNPEDLFYFSSRGIEKGAARAMVTEGFLRSAWESLKHAQVRDHLQKNLDRYLYSR